MVDCCCARHSPEDWRCARRTAAPPRAPDHFLIWLHRSCNDAPDELDHLGRVPLGRPDQAADLASITVDEERRRQAQRAQRAQRLAGAVEIHGESADADIGKEFAHGIHASAVDRQRYDLEVRATEPSLQTIERRHLVATGTAPGCPNIEKHHLAFEIGKVSRLALSIVEFDRGHRLGCIMHHKVLRRLLPGRKLRGQHDDRRSHRRCETVGKRGKSERHCC